MSTIKCEIECPFCNKCFLVDVEWVKKNERVFCDSCCKAFDFKIKEKMDLPTYYGEFND